MPNRFAILLKLIDSVVNNGVLVVPVASACDYVVSTRASSPALCLQVTWISAGSAWCEFKHELGRTAPSQFARQFVRRNSLLDVVQENG